MVEAMNEEKIRICCETQIYFTFKEFGEKCCKLLKEQRTRFYILKRCVAMLICWHESTDT